MIVLQVLLEDNGLIQSAQNLAVLVTTLAHLTNGEKLDVPDATGMKHQELSFSMAEAEEIHVCMCIPKSPICSPLHGPARSSLELPTHSFTDYGFLFFGCTVCSKVRTTRALLVKRPRH